MEKEMLFEDMVKDFMNNVSLGAGTTFELRSKVF